MEDKGVWGRGCERFSVAERRTKRRGVDIEGKRGSSEANRQKPARSPHEYVLLGKQGVESIFRLIIPRTKRGGVGSGYAGLNRVAGVADAVCSTRGMSPPRPSARLEWSAGGAARLGGPSWGAGRLRCVCESRRARVGSGEIRETPNDWTNLLGRSVVYGLIYWYVAEGSFDTRES